MFKMIYKITDKLREKLSEKGQGMVEYALVLAAVALIAGFVLVSDGTNGLKKSISGAFGNASTQINNATTTVNSASGNS